MVYKLKNYFENWLRPIIISIFCGLIFTFSEFINNSIFGVISLFIFGTSLFLLFISANKLLFKRKWLQSILSFLMFFINISFFIAFEIFLIFTNFDSPDNWAKNLKIPTNIKIEKPLNLNNEERPDTNIIVQPNKINFQLYNSFQPGLYEYDVWINKIEKGKVYLKAYEYTSKIALSEESLNENSIININNPTDSIMKFGTKKYFTIYEGDWGDSYASRFELWFKPKNGGPERKLLTKNYIIEGWMR